MAPALPLTGIARLAALAPTLDQKARVLYSQLPARSLLSRCNSPRVPFEWTINPYRGCEFGCKYCYARYTHEFMELREPEDFERRIFAKHFDASAFRRELARVRPGERIAIGTATDPYQPAERRYGVTRRILELLAREHGLRLTLTTKGNLVARDAALLARAARSNILHLNMTVTTMDAELARLIEPLAPRPDLRLEAVRAAAEAGVQTGVLACPLLPLLTDSAASLDAVAREARRAGARYFGAGTVFLKPAALQVLLPLLEERFPRLARRYRERFGGSAFLGGPYVEMVKERARAARARWGLEKDPVEYAPEGWEGEQMKLFTLQST